MMFRVALVLCLVGGASAASSLLARDLGTSLKERPVMKVVRLLQDMKAELQASLDDDKAVHEKLTCWCNSNDDEKQKAIDMGTASLSQLQSSMDSHTAKILEIKSNRKATQEEMFADQKALGEATEIRFTEAKAAHQEDKDYTEAIMAAGQAVVALSKHHPELVQVRAAAQAMQSSQLSQLLAKTGRLQKAQMDALKDFMTQAPSSSSFLSIPGMQSYAPQSGQIFGILKQMKEDFEADLSESQKTEAKSKSEYESLKAAKEAQIAAAERAIVQADADLAEFGEKHAQAASEYEDTEAQLALDTEFLATLKERCAKGAAEFDARVAARTEEIAAVEDTIKILNSDESFENMDKTVNSDSFLQTASVSAVREQQRMLQGRAASVLARAASQSGEPRLALLAVTVKLDEFQKVKQEIDKLIAELNVQQQDEVTHRDWCRDELANNDRSMTAADDKKEGLLVKISDLEKTVEQLKANIVAGKAANKEMQEQMKRASETREAENADFQTTITDQRMTQVILNKALDRMRQVYALLQGPGAPHTQTSATHTDPGNGPARFTKMEKHAGGSRVLTMLEEVIADSKKVELDSIVAEEDAQSAYEVFMKDGNKSITQTSRSLNDMSNDLAKAKEGHSMAKSDLSSTMTQLDGLNNYKGDLHKSCDFVLKNFDARQAARSAEVDALKEAKAILSGMQ